MLSLGSRHAALGVLIILMLGVAVPRGWGQEGNRIGTVLVVDGTAEVRSQNAATWEPLRFRDDIFLLDTVRTAADSKLKVLLNDESIITVVERSEMQFNEFLVDQQQRRSVMGLLVGKIRVLTTRFFGTDSATEVHTPNTVTGVRGSEIIVQYSEDAQQTSMLCESVTGPQQDHCFLRDPTDPNRVLNVPVGHIVEQVGSDFPEDTRVPTVEEREALTGDILVTEQIDSEVLPTGQQGPTPPDGGLLSETTRLAAVEGPQPPVFIEPPGVQETIIDLQTEVLTPDTTPTAQSDLSRFIIDITR